MDTRVARSQVWVVLSLGRFCLILITTRKTHLRRETLVRKESVLWTVGQNGVSQVQLNNDIEPCVSALNFLELCWGWELALQSFSQGKMGMDCVQGKYIELSQRSYSTKTVARHSCVHVASDRFVRRFRKDGRKCFTSVFFSIPLYTQELIPKCSELHEKKWVDLAIEFYETQARMAFRWSKWTTILSRVILFARDCFRKFSFSPPHFAAFLSQVWKWFLLHDLWELSRSTWEHFDLDSKTHLQKFWRWDKRGHEFRTIV